MTKDKGEWVSRVGRRRSDNPIQLSDLQTVEAQAGHLQAAGVLLLRQMLAEFAGRRAASPQEGQEIVERVRHMAKQFGVRLIYEEKPIYLKWAKYVFMATTTDSSRGHIHSSAEFLRLDIEEPKINKTEPDQTTEPGHKIDRNSSRPRHK